MLKAQEIQSQFDSLVFGSGDESRNATTQIFLVAALALLYLGGVIHWVVFFQSGAMSFEKLDWGDGYFYYVAARDMVSSQAFPYFTSATAPAWGDVRFLANPQSFLSPQIVFFPLMSVGHAVVFNTLLMYSLGFIGILLIKRHFQLSLVPFTVLFLIFNFNGHLTSHLSVGHSTWNGYFLLPFFFLVLLKMFRNEGSVGIRTPIILGFLLLLMIMQGSFHIFVWCMMFLLVIGLVHRRYFMASTLAIIFGMSMSLFRLIPTAMVRLDYSPSYASGYPTVNTLIDALTAIKAHLYEHPRGPIYDVGWHEHDLYIGFIGLAFILFYGVFHRFSGARQVRGLEFKALDLPVILFVLLSMGFVFDVISDLQVPLLSWAERVPSRFMVIPLIVLTILAAIRMEALLSQIRNSNTLKVLCLIGVGLLAHTLGAHSWFWRLNAQDPAVADPNLMITFDWPANHDAVYVAIVNASWGLSIAAIVAVIGLFLWSWRANRGSSAG